MSVNAICSSAVASFAAFCATNIDEFLLLVASFARCSVPLATLTLADVFFGNAVGFLAILGLSGAGVALGLFLPARYVKLLGFIPLLMGLRTLVRRALKKCSMQRLQRAAQEPLLMPDAPSAAVSEEGTLGGAEKAAEGGAAAAASSGGAPPSGLRATLGLCCRAGVAEMAALTIAGGAEEVSVYLPLLSTPSIPAIATTVVVLTVMMVAWQALALALVRQQRVAKAVEDWGEAFEPWLLVALGVWVLLDSVVLPVEVAL